MTAKKTDTNARQRIIVFLSSFVLFGFTYYGHNITSQRVKVLNHGTTSKLQSQKQQTKELIRRFTSRYNEELDGGENFGRYKDVNIGDVISVKYLPGIKYVVADGVNSHRNMIIFQYLCFGISLTLLFTTIDLYDPTGTEANVI